MMTCGAMAQNPSHGRDSPADPQQGTSTWWGSAVSTLTETFFGSRSEGEDDDEFNHMLEKAKKESTQQYVEEQTRIYSQFPGATRKEIPMGRPVRTPPGTPPPLSPPRQSYIPGAGIESTPQASPCSSFTGGIDYTSYHMDFSDIVPMTPTQGLEPPYPMELTSSKEEDEDEDAGLESESDGESSSSNGLDGMFSFEVFPGFSS